MGRMTAGTPAPDLAEMLDILDAHLAALTGQVWAPRYELSPVFAIGGPTGTYQIPPQWPSTYEYQVIGACFGDVGQLILSSMPQPSAPALGAIFDGGARANQIPLIGAAAGTLTLAENWQPAPAQQMLYVATSVTNSHSAWVLIQFRRRVNAAGMPAEGF